VLAKKNVLGGTNPDRVKAAALELLEGTRSFAASTAQDDTP
jgi:hypothetical protein